MAAIDTELWERVRTQDVPLVLTRLSDFTIQEATSAYFEQIPLSPDQLIGQSVFSLMDADEQPRAREALQALADGTIDFYRTYRHLSVERAHVAGVYVWSHAIDFGERRYALTQVRATAETTDSPLMEVLGYEPARFAIGVVDRAGIVTTVSNDVEEVVGIKPAALVGHFLLPREQRDVWLSFHSPPYAPHTGCSMALPYHTPPSCPDVGPIQCLMVCLVQSDTYCFILSREPSASPARVSERSTELEYHLLRIAQEVQASGVVGALDRIPDPERFPQLASLSSRQWDVLVRLLRGDRVPAIATGMFLSQSAVRNYLSQLFKAFGVHSQSELVSLLRS